MIRYLKPTLNLITPNTVKNRIIEMFEIKRQELKQQIQLNESKFSLTTDIWTSPTNLAYMVVTIHFIDNEWKLVSKVLDFVPFPGNHSGYKIFEICSGIIDEFRIKGRVLAFTTDNASNNDILIENLLLHGYLDSAESHQRCFAHVLNLSAQKSLR